MNHSESIKELATALAKAQGSMKGALKDTKNEFFKSKYADLASVVEAIRAAFSENGLSYVQTTEPSEKNEVRIETLILHSSGEWLSSGVLSMPVTKTDAQGYGSALTYARRYSLSAAAGVAPEDDDGNAAAKAAPKDKNEWTIEDEDLFVGIMDRAYTAYKSSPKPEGYETFAAKCKARKVEPPQKVLQEMEAHVSKLELATKGRV